MSLANQVLPPALIQDRPIQGGLDLARTNLLGEAAAPAEAPPKRPTIKQRLGSAAKQGIKGAAKGGAAGLGVDLATGGATGGAATAGGAAIGGIRGAVKGFSDPTGEKAAAAAKAKEQAKQEKLKKPISGLEGAIRGIAGAPIPSADKKGEAGTEKKDGAEGGGEAEKKAEAPAQPKPQQNAVPHDPTTHHEVVGPDGPLKVSKTFHGPPHGTLKHHPQHQGVLVDNSGRMFAHPSHPIHQVGIHGMNQAAAGGGGWGGMSAAAQGFMGAGGAPAPAPAQSGTAAPAASTAQQPGWLARAAQGYFGAKDTQRAAAQQQPSQQPQAVAGQPVAGATQPETSIPPKRGSTDYKQALDDPAHPHHKAVTDYEHGIAKRDKKAAETQLARQQADQAQAAADAHKAETEKPTKTATGEAPTSPVVNPADSSSTRMSSKVDPKGADALRKKAAAKMAGKPSEKPSPKTGSGTKTTPAMPKFGSGPGSSAGRLRAADAAEKTGKEIPGKGGEESTKRKGLLLPATTAKAKDSTQDLISKVGDPSVSTAERQKALVAIHNRHGSHATAEDPNNDHIMNANAAYKAAHLISQSETGKAVGPRALQKAETQAKGGRGGKKGDPDAAAATSTEKETEAEKPTKPETGARVQPGERPRGTDPSREPSVARERAKRPEGDPGPDGGRKTPEDPAKAARHEAFGKSHPEIHGSMDKLRSEEGDPHKGGVQGAKTHGYRKGNEAVAMARRQNPSLTSDQEEKIHHDAYATYVKNWHDGDPTKPDKPGYIERLKRGKTPTQIPAAAETVTARAMQRASAPTKKVVGLEADNPPLHLMVQEWI